MCMGRSEWRRMAALGTWKVRRRALRLRLVWAAPMRLLRLHWTVRRSHSRPLTRLLPVRLLVMYTLRTSFAQSRVEERMSECGSGEFATIAATANVCGPPLLYLTYLCSLQASSACRASGAAARLRKAARESVAPRLA